MPRVFKASMYFVDPIGNFNSKEFMKNELEIFSENNDLEIRIIDLQISEEFEWNDDLVINYKHAEDVDYEYYFEQPTKKYLPGIRPVDSKEKKLSFGHTRYYENDFDKASEEMKIFIQLGFQCKLETLQGTPDYVLTVFKE